MTNKTVCMLRIRKLIQLLDKGLSQRKISSALKMGRNILSGYIARIERKHSARYILPVESGGSTFAPKERL